MTEQGRAAAQAWREPSFAQAWSSADSTSTLLDFPRRLAAATVAFDRPTAGLVVDVASGPGGFLATFLEQYPEAKGIWTDASDAMLDQAKERLAPWEGRVEFLVGDMTDLAGSGVPKGADVIVTSRATHHLDRSGLLDFYAEAAGMLQAGGWLVNLDHTGPSDVWDKRFRAVRASLDRRPADLPSHHHNYPLTSVQDHLDGYEAAGIDDVEIAWKAWYTCLFMGKKPAALAG